MMATLPDLRGCFLRIQNFGLISDQHKNLNTLSFLCMYKYSSITPGKKSEENDTMIGGQ